MLNGYLKLPKESFLTTPNHVWENRITFTPRELHELLGVPLSTIYALCASGKLKAFRVGSRWLVHRDGLYDFLQDQIDSSIVL